jgi:orotidine-5'-phosphate decarboxylase
VRELAPTLPLLIPGVGAQGGDAQATVQAGWRPGAPVMVNSSRAILYASSGSDFASAARAVAQQTRAALNAARSSSAHGENAASPTR